VTLRATVTAEEEARMIDGSGRWVFRVEARRRTDPAWTDVTNVAGGDWVLGIRADGETPDRPSTGFTVRFLRAADGASLAPGISASPLNRNAEDVFSPLVFPGRLIRVAVGCLAPGQVRAQAAWHPWLEGDVDRAEWPDDVTAQCSTLDGRIMRRQIEELEESGAPEPGRPLQEEIQRLLDRWMGPGVVALRVIGDPEQGIGRYIPPRGSLGGHLLSLAQRFAWDLRYLWDDATASFRYTLYLPPRGKTEPDLELGPDVVQGVPGLSVDRENVRNAFTTEFPDRETGRRAKVFDADPASIAEYDRVWMGLFEPPDSTTWRRRRR
jgi:hypothetical protein